MARREIEDGSNRYLEGQLNAAENEFNVRSNEDFQPKNASFSKLETIVQAMDPPPNCTSLGLDTRSFFGDSTADRHNRLECFLWNLKVEIPEQSFSKGWLTITVQDMLCTNFRLRGLQSNSSIAPLDSLDVKSNDVSALRLSVQTVSATCQGKYHSTGGLSGNILATVAQSSPSLQALDLLVDVQGKQGANKDNTRSSATVKLPVSFETKECGTSLGCESIRFSGSISAKMIQAFSGKVGRYITQTLQEQVCPLMTKVADPIVTAYLKEFDDLVKPYLEEDTAVIGTTLDDSNLPMTNDQFHMNNRNTEIQNIMEFTVIERILSFVNEQLQYHLQTGWIPLPPPSYHESKYRRISQECIDSFRGISGWIISILGRRPHIPLPNNLRHIVFPIPEEIGTNGTIALTIPEMIVEGLDEMDALQIFAPSESKDLKTKLITNKGFSIVLPIKLEIRWPDLQGKKIDVSTRSTLQESFRLTINVTHIDLALSSLIQVVNFESTTLLQVISTVQKYVESRNSHDLACLIRTLHSVQLFQDKSFVFHNILIDAIRLSRDKKTVPDGSLEADFDHVINTILDLFLTDYADLWTHLVRGLVRGPGSRRLNQYIESWIQKHSKIKGDVQHDGDCPSISTSPGQWANFSKFEVLNTFNRYLDHSHTKKSLNDFFLCLAESIEDVFDDDNGLSEYVVSNRALFLEDGDIIGDVMSYLPDDSITPSLVDMSSSIFELLTENAILSLESGKRLSFRDDISETKVTLSSLELRNWDSIQKLQIMKPSGDTSLSSYLLYGEKPSVEEVDDGEVMSVIISNSMQQSTLPAKGPPEIAMVVDLHGKLISGQLNFTVFGGLDASTEINVDYDLNRLENLTISRLLNEIDCALLPAIQIRFLPRVTNVTFGKHFGANLTAAIEGRNFSLSTNDFPRFFDLSNDALSWSQEIGRTALNLAIEKLIESSISKCPGIVDPNNDHDDEKGDSERSIYWLWRDSTALWIILGLFVMMQGGLFYIYPIYRQGRNIDEPTQISDGAQIEAVSHTMPLLSSYQELMSHPSAQTPDQNQGIKRSNSIDDHIIRDICDDWNGEDELQGILEDQLVEEFQGKKISLFDSEKIPEVIKYLIPIMIIGTISLFLCSNLSIGASVDLSVEVRQQSIGIPGIFQFSLSNTVSEMYMAGIYPLLILVLCFSGIWPYVKLLLMLYSWMIPSADQHKQERRLLALDAMGKYSLVDNYVLILFVVAFRFQLGITDSLGIDVYVTPVYGFFSFLFATCLSLVLGHAVLFFHRKTMQHHDIDSESISKSLILNHGFRTNTENTDRKRLSRVGQGLLVSLLITTFGFLTRGFLQESFTFEIGGVAGVMLGEDANRTSYSVLSLGAALPSSVEDPQSQSIVFLQATFFFFTVVTPILCLILIFALMLAPLTLKWQRHLLVAAEIANSWSAVEVFLLSILAALFQISTFASFMIGDKCDEINILAEKLFDQKDTVCFTVDASVESNCWYLLVGAMANMFLVSFLLGFAETAVEEKMEDICRANETPSDTFEFFSNTKRSDQRLIQKLLNIPLFHCNVFTLVPTTAPVAVEDSILPLEGQIEEAA